MHLYNLLLIEINLLGRNTSSSFLEGPTRDSSHTVLIQSMSVKHKQHHAQDFI